MLLKELLKEEKERSDNYIITESDLKPEDDDSWIELKPETFDDMLKAHFKLKDNINEETTKTKSKQEIPNEVKNFLKAMSDFEGVEEHSESPAKKKSKSE